MLLRKSDSIMDKGQDQKNSTQSQQHLCAFIFSTSTSLHTRIAFYIKESKREKYVFPRLEFLHRLWNIHFTLPQKSKRNPSFFTRAKCRIARVTWKREKHGGYTKEVFFCKSLPRNCSQPQINKTTNSHDEPFNPSGNISAAEYWPVVSSFYRPFQNPITGSQDCMLM